MKTTRNMVLASLLAALTCVATMVIKIPSPLHGYINLGDCVVLLAGWMLSPTYSFLAAGIGSALADVFSGYVTYAPASFVIKGVMALAAGYVFNHMKNAAGELPARIIGGTVAEIIMVAGYLMFESVLYGFVPSLANVPANAVQGVAGLIIGTALIKLFEKNKIIA